MKIIKTVFFSLLIMATTSLYASDNGDKKKDDSRKPDTLLSVSDVDLSGYGAPYVSFSRLGEKAGVFVGGRGGLIINDSFVIGAGGMGLTYPTRREDISGTSYEGDMPHVTVGYGGGILEYHILPKKLFHVSIGVLIGGGGLSLSDKSDEDEGGNDHDRGTDKFFVVEPELYLYVNVTRFLRIGIGGSYRYVNGINTEEFTDKDLRGATASVIASFGWF